MKASIIEFVMQDAYRINKTNTLAQTFGRYMFNISYRVRFQMRLLQYLQIRGWNHIRKLLLFFISVH